MTYESLYKLHRKQDPSYEEKYSNRYHSEFTERLGIMIKEYRRPIAYEAFYCYPPELTNLLLNIEQAKASLDAVMQAASPIMLTHLLNSFLIDEIKSTNDIEGVRSSRRDIKDSLQNTSQLIPKRFQGIVAKYKTMIAKEETIPFATCEDVRHFYDEFMAPEMDRANLPDGHIFRKESVDITTQTGKVLHQGLYPESAILEAMEKALAILGNQSLLWPIRLAVFHYLFGYIHPFYDGNGRTSRFITSYYLAQFTHPLVGLRISNVIKKNQKLYYEAFTSTNAATNRGDLTYFILIFLELIEKTMLNTKELLEKRRERLHRSMIRLDELFRREAIEDDTIRAIYRAALEASLFSLHEGLTKDELSRMIGKSRRTIDYKFKEIPEEHMVLTKQGRTIHIKLNVDILATIKK